jgi:WD40 repeat protein
MANVFISHSSADNDWAGKIYVWLEEDGHELFLDRDVTDGIVVGDDWERRLYERLRWADAVVCVVSEPYVESVWCAAEIGASLALGIELLPVGVSQQKVRHTLLKTLQGVDAANNPEAARAALRSRLKVIDGGGGWGWPDGKPPYPGLRSFELDEHRVFFGRSHEISSITKRLRSSERAQSAVLLVVGPSGCGKSSLVRAGVLPRIAGEDYWLSLPPIVPGIDPLGNLVRAIADFLVAQRISYDTKSLRKDIERDGLRAVAHDLLLAAGAASHCKLLVVIDQFEELLTQTEPAERSEFVAALEPALGGPIQVMATLRSEYVDAWGKDSDLRNLRTRIYQVRPLESDALREVIEKPANVAGLTFEDDLVTRLIADTGTGDALPLLAFTLEQLAEDMTRGDCMTHKRYDEIGGVQGALQRQAEEALKAACEATGKPPDQVIDELLNLVTIDEEGRPSKRRLALEESSDHEETLKPFLERRLLSTEVVDKTTSITVSHDAFLVNWPPLHKEIDAKVIALRTRRVVENAARDWEANKRDAATLLKDPQLTKAKVDTGAEFEVDRDGMRLTTRVDLNDSARDFLTSSEKADRAEKARAKRKTVRVVALLSVITLAAVALAGWAFYSQGLAKDRERDAIAQRLIAEARVKLYKTVNTEGLQRLLAGRSLAATKVSDETLYPVVVGSASTFKIMQNPLRPGGVAHLPVQSVSVDRDGALIVAGSNDNTVRLWDARSGELVREIPLNGPRSVGTVAFDPSGTRIAVGGSDGTLHVIDAQNGDRIGTVMPHLGAVSSVAFGHDGQWIATGDSTGTVRVWDVTKGTTFETIPSAASGPVAKSVAFSPTADVVAAAYGNGVRLFDARDGRVLAKWESRAGPTQERPGYPVTTVAFNHSGDRLVVGGTGGTIDLLDGRTLQPLASQRAHPAIVNSLAFNTDGTRIVSGGDDGAVKVWDAKSLAPLGDTFRGHGGSVTSVAFTHDGTRIVSGSVDGTVRVWNAVFGLSIPADQGGSVLSVDFSPDKSKVASGGVDGTVKLWDTRTAALVTTLGQPSPGNAHHAINSLAYFPDGSRIVTASDDGRVVVWDTASGSSTELNTDPPPAGLPIPMRRMKSVAVDPDGNYIAAGGFDGLVRLWNAHSLDLIDAMPAQMTNEQGQTVPYQVWSVAFDRHGRQLVTGSGVDKFLNAQNLIQVWNLKTRTPDGDPIPGPAGKTVFAVAFVTDDKLVSGSSDGTVRVWDMNARKEISDPLFRDASPVYSLAALHNGPLIAAGGGGGVVRVWDIKERPPEDTPLEGHRDWVLSVAVNLDDSLIASASAEGDLRLWPGPGDIGEAICSKLTLNPSHKQWDEWVEGKKDYEKLCPNLEPAPDG